MNKFSEYNTFWLCKPMDDKTIPTGTPGVVLLVLGGKPHDYEVEFPDGQGGNLGKELIYTVNELLMSRNAPPDRRS